MIKMKEAPIGEIVFREEILKEYNEVRETYYTRTGENSYQLHGCIQGAPELDEDERPRYINVTMGGCEYPLSNFNIKPVAESRFWKFVI